jgi:hypothetical protein
MRHGIPPEQWELAKGEAKNLMIEAARKRRMITYSELVRGILSIKIEAHDPRLFHMLGEISSEENAEGRGMLTALVVHKHGDMEPGKVFYELAASLGRNVADQKKCWIDELHKVHAHWSISKSKP